MRVTRMRGWIFGLLAGLLLLASACSNNGGDAGSAGNDFGAGGASVGATEKDFAIALDPTTVNGGNVTFKIENQGPSVHEFVIFQTDLDESDLPLTKDANGIPIVDENGKGVQHIDEVEDIANGSTETLSVDLQPGNYVAICNLPAHYQQGMHAGFTVQ